uniref:Uncharacterized protein n=1 Tax=Arundo donax TaxID=35708 RepID=A0A0A8Y733_ARUDO
MNTVHLRHVTLFRLPYPDDFVYQNQMIRTRHTYIFSCSMRPCLLYSVSLASPSSSLSVSH